MEDLCNLEIEREVCGTIMSFYPPPLKKKCCLSIIVRK
jgi:hypothetical protein